MRAIHSCRSLLVLLALFSFVGVSIGDESAVGGNDGATISPTETDDGFNVNDLLPGLEDPNRDSFVQNYIMGQPMYYKDIYEPVSQFKDIIAFEK